MAHESIVLRIDSLDIIAAGHLIDLLNARRSDACQLRQALRTEHYLRLMFSIWLSLCRSQRTRIKVLLSMSMGWSRHWHFNGALFECAIRTTFSQLNSSFILYFDLIFAEFHYFSLSQSVDHSLASVELKLEREKNGSEREKRHLTVFNEGKCSCGSCSSGSNQNVTVELIQRQQPQNRETIQPFSISIALHDRRAVRKNARETRQRSAKTWEVPVFKLNKASPVWAMCIVHVWISCKCGFLIMIFFFGISICRIVSNTGC